MIIIFLLFLCFGSLSAETQATVVNPFVLAVTEGEPHLNICNAVSPITGDFYLSRDDIVIEGVEPLHIPSLYVSGDGRAPYKGKVGWDIIPHQKLISFKCSKEKINQMIVTDRNGTRLKFEQTIENEFHIDLKNHGPGIANDAKGVLSARTHLRNSYVVQKDKKKISFYCADGTERRYKFWMEDQNTSIHDSYKIFLLKWERLPNGNYIYYKYDSKNRIKSIKTKNHTSDITYAWAKFTYTEENPNFTIKTSDGRVLNYKFEPTQYKSKSEDKAGISEYVDVYLLNKVTRSYGPSEYFHYQPGHHGDGPRLSEVALPNHRFFSPSYYVRHENNVEGVHVYLKKKDCRKNRVKTISAPVGFDDKPIITHRFFYDPNKQKDYSYEFPCKSEIYDVDNNLMIVLANEYCRPVETQWYHNRNGQQHLVFSEKTYWSSHELEIGNLKAKLFSDPSSGSSYAKIYHYDMFGNVISEKICGNLSGLAPSSLSLQSAAPKPSKKVKFHILDQPGQDLLLTRDLNSDTVTYFHRVGVGLYVSHPKTAATAESGWRLIKTEGKEATFQQIDTAPLTITPSSTEVYETTYGYTPDHLMAWKKEPNGRITRFSYLGSTDLLSSRFTCDGDKILTREFFEYNEDRILIRTILDDGTTSDLHDLTGVTQRQIKSIIPRKAYPNLGLPEMIEEYYLEQGEQSLLRKTVLAYNQQGKITSQDIYDSEGKFRYRLTHEYDSRGRLISESNPLGQIQRYEYDECDNKTVIKDYSGRLILRHTYDYSNRLIQTIEEGDDGNRRATYHKYNLKNQKISTIAPNGGETLYTYDPFDRLLETKLPSSHTLKATYDGFGRQLSSTDGNGHTTFQTYNARGKPTSIHHPDGTVETYIYNSDGSLRSHVDQQGTAIDHTYDVLGRLISKKITSATGEALSTESWSYGPFQLLSKTDAEGSVTTYEYDGAGRKIADVCKGDRTEYVYDALGRVAKTRCGNRVTSQDYDLLGRIIEERTEELDGNILTKTLYAYDKAGNKTETTHWTSVGPSTEITLFDSFKRPLQHVDALGHITATTYDDDALQKITTDPEGTRLIETYDLLGRLDTLQIKSPSNELLHQEIYIYDGAGNKIQQQTIVMGHRTPPKTITTLWEYGPLKRLLMLTEAAGRPEQRTTRYSYTVRGLLQKTDKPDGTAIAYTYDALNRLQEVISSDCHYRFTYNLLHQPTIIEDLIQNSRTLRIYDHRCRLVSETLANHLTLHSSYDSLGRKTDLCLPDKSSIAYSYDAAFLRRITRYSSTGQNLYSHEYTRFDPSSRLLEQQLIHDLGAQSFEIDPLGRTTAAFSSYFNARASFDSRGNLQSLEQEGESFHYAYDDLSQLIAEKNHQYLHDSNHNRTFKNGKKFSLNHLNQLDSLSYDPNGNPLTDGATRFKYDSLDRLISATTETHHAQFTYDPFHRRLSKKLFVQQAGEWVLQSHLRYLYDGDNEIGAADASGTLIELRILGLGRGAEIGASIAIELDGRSYAPIHDLRGNIIKLVSETGQVAESYSYTAFGEETASNPRNPWRFSSKRTDTEFNLIYYGRRFYSPALGRWLTPDPQGFTDGMNLYAFVHNNPLLKFDPYGLESCGYNINISVSLTTCMQLASLATSCAGMGLAAIGKHALPGALGDMTNALGNAMAGLSYTRPKSQVATVGYRSPSDNSAITAVNGILNSLEDGLKFAKKISQSHNESFVHLVYNSSHGFFSDILEVLLDAFGIGSHPSRLLAMQWRSLILEFHGKGITDGEIFHYAHSQGGSITENALRHLTPEEKNYLNVVTFGSSSLFPKELARSVVHYVSIRDGVPMTNILGYLRALACKATGQSSHVQFVGNFWGVPFVDHPWKNDCYLSKLRQHGEQFQDTYFNP
jgi:RHS repeat-associated protein